MKLQESNGKSFLTVPKVIVRQKGWVKGQELYLIFNERGNVEITDKM